MTDTNNKTRRSFLKAAAISTVGAGIGGGTLSAAESQPSTKASSLPAKVPRKKLGATGQSIPCLLVGCAQKFDPKYDKILHRAFKDGVDYLDTAIVYADGQSHRTIAPFIKQIGDRSKLWITSKGPSKNATVESYTEDLDRCLEELETDYLDLFFMHALDDPKFLAPEFIRMGERLRASKKTRFFGFSCHGDHQVELLNKAAKVGGIDAIMFRYSFAKYGDLELNKAIDACRKAGIGLIAMKTQDSVPGDQEDVLRFKSRQFTLAQAKLKAVWADERIDAAVSHMDNTKKLAENIAAAKSPSQLTMNEFQQLQRLATARAEHSCQGCSHICEAHFPEKTAVARPLRYLMYHQCYGETERARALYAQLSPEERDFTGVDLRAATRACPQGIAIEQRLVEAGRQLA
ncbi:MAG: aldo/keto reductase [Acidobacteriota bacterium]